jgi:hypothetical protein
MAVNKISLKFGWLGGNCSDYIQSGWSKAEQVLRRSQGNVSAIALPPIGASKWYLLTCDVTFPKPLGSERPELGISINGIEIDRFSSGSGTSVAIIVPGAALSAESTNLIVFRNYIACEPTPATCQGSDENLGFAWQSLALSPIVNSEFVKPGLLPEQLGEDVLAAEIATAFQSLGQNCECGLFQRRCDVEPLGLLRWAYIKPPELLRGLTRRFEGISDVSALSLRSDSPGGHLTGYHDVYGLEYHTYLMESDVDVTRATQKESDRLGFLARMLIEQLEADEKIFVRSKGFSAMRELRRLHLAMRVYNPTARLLYVDEAPSDARELIGRVEWLAPGLYKGYLDRFAPEENAYEFSFDVWLRICKTVFHFDRSVS